MGEIKVRHLVTRPSGHYYQATPAMRAAGIESESLPADPVEAARRAEFLNRCWDELRAARRAGRQATPPAGSFDWLVWRLKQSQEWHDKSERTREEVGRALAELQPVFGQASLEAITPARVAAFYRRLRLNASLHKSALVMKWFRYLLNFGLRLHPDLVPANPTYAVRISQPRPRRQVWSEAQVAKAIKQAWRRRWYGVALVIAIAYDTGLRPQDIRALTPAQFHGPSIRVAPLKTRHLDDDEKAVPLWPETLALVARYKRRIGLAFPPDLPLLRSAKGRPFASRHHLAKQVRQILRAAGIADQVQLRDLRRTGSKEAAEAGATSSELASRTLHRIGQGQQILDTYSPASLELARAAQAKRRKGKG